MVGYVISMLLQIVHRVCQWKKIENQSIIGEDMDKSKMPHFLAHPVHLLVVYTLQFSSAVHNITVCFAAVQFRKCYVCRTYKFIEVFWDFLSACANNACAVYSRVKVDWMRERSLQCCRWNAGLQQYGTCIKKIWSHLRWLTTRHSVQQII